MDRRRLLTLLAGSTPLLAGCNGFGADDDPGTPFAPPEETPTTGPDTVTAENVVTGLGRYVRSVSEFGEPRTIQLFSPTFRVGGVQVVATFVRDATPDHPPTLQVTLRNVLDKALTVPAGATPPLSSYVARSSDGRPGLVLVPSETSRAARLRPDGPVDGVWRAAADPVETAVESDTLELGSEAAIRRRYLVLAPPDATALPTGEFTTETTAYEWTPRFAVWNHLRPGRTRESRFEAGALPPLPTTTATQWFHEVGPRTELYLDPGAEAADLPAVSLRYGLRNYTDQRTTYDRDDFGLYRFEDGRWWDLAPPGGFADGPNTAVFPGGTGEIGLLVANRDDVSGDVPPSTVARQWLGAGTYALSVTTRYAGSRDREPITHAAALELRGEPLALSRSPFVESTRRDGDRLVLTHESYGDNVGDNRGRLTVTVAPDAADPEPRIAEQLMASVGLRDTLHALTTTDATEALLRTSWRTAADALERAGSTDGESAAIAYDGTTVAVRAERA